MEKINKDMKIGEIVQKFPETIEVMLSTGLHCVGCGAAFGETLEQGVKVHGGSDEDVKGLVDAMNKAVEEDSKK